MAKLQPLLYHCKFFMKFVFVLSFYNALYCRYLYATLCRAFANRVTIGILQAMASHYWYIIAYEGLINGTGVVIGFVQNI